MCPFGEAQDESGCSILYGLESTEELGGDAGIESVAVDEAAGDQGLSDGLSCVGRDPSEDSAEHAECSSRRRRLR